MTESVSQKKIAIVGATSHIAKGLTVNFTKSGRYKVSLFSRNVERTEAFLNAENIINRVAFIGLPEEFRRREHDTIINCVGYGQPAKLIEAGGDIFRLTEAYDNSILDYLVSHPRALYINLSSGAVYGAEFNEPASRNTVTRIDVNDINVESYYCIAKINSEAKHRAFKHFNIVDLRIFSYFSRFVDIGAKYFMTEIITCLKNGETFITNSEDMTRDYVHPSDLFSMVEAAIAKPELNDSLDVYSRKPVSKFEVLDHFAREFGLKYKVKEIDLPSTTGRKNVYCSNNKKAELLGYKPQFSSLDVLVQESKAILKEC